MSTSPVFDELFAAEPGMNGGGAVSPTEFDRLFRELRYQVDGPRDWWKIADIACRLANVRIDPNRITGTPRLGGDAAVAATTKRQLSKGIRHTVYEVFGTDCVYCGDSATTVDHVIPQAKGGTDDLENLRPACLPCNTSKGAKDLDQWDGPPHRREAVQ